MMMLNRSQHMGGRSQEKNALEELERIRLQLIDRCEYQNEKNWVASVSCLNRISLSKVLFYDEIVRRITNIPGVVMELGVQWGALTSLLYNLTSVREPYNFRRQIVGFDTFSGFPERSLSQAELDQGWKAHDLAGAADAKQLAERCLEAHQVFSGMSHMSRHEFVEGDVMETLPVWFDANPSATVALCVFDMDLGIPTREALKHVLARSQKGTVLVFDEYAHPRFPEEGMMVRQVIDTMKLQPMKSELLPYTSYIVL
ncbi:hypothetical protein ONR75_25075 [Rhodopseudomonas sp. P2A-2r]|uniref:TylF/MycF/NovP-related O-methyltransferase n=1 Tax=Rhodopseudomonas sp. P2A-2r TaxID=2991972 RepID=UPI002234386D|nr:TylF/MycF/NovP-related O-methyltransferase [Rhodopseudomonas sp. P2A-2r]UZE48085.1 hypothetical protein ONR75_25075 [Rhodopseudomonas sp. P2A-2r]